MKAKELRDLIDFISDTGLEEVNIETEDFKIKVKRSAEGPLQVAQTPLTAPPQPPSTAPATTSGSAEKPEAPASDVDTSKLVQIKSPMIGTFYRSPNPDSDVFVKIGDKVSVGNTVCIIEAMKLFNEIESDISGTIVEILAEDATPVEYDQPLFLVDPS